MNNNSIIRRIRFIFDYNDSKMIELFEFAGKEVTRAEISDWLKKDDDEAFQALNDQKLAFFLSGMIVANRGKKDGEVPIVEKQLNNNIILRKLKIALELKDEDILDILDLVDMRISKHELSAFFRHPDHAHYRTCKDQILRNFLLGMQVKYADEK